MKTNKIKGGFGIIELLVVISIMAILIAILLPALSYARQQAKTIVCSSNIHQLYIANQGYASENNGNYVIAAKDIWGQNLHRWHGTREDINKPFDPEKGPLVGYLADGKVNRCPEFKKYHKKSGQVSANFEAGCGGYGYNDQYIGGRYDLYKMGKGAGYSIKAYQVAENYSTVMFTDSAFRQIVADGSNEYIEYSFAHPPYWQWYLEAGNTGLGDSVYGRPDPTIHFRHGKFSNVCWCDGHISKETMELSAPYITHAIMSEEGSAEMSLGWFGPDNNSLFDAK